MKYWIFIFCFWMNVGFSQVQVFDINQIDSLMQLNPKPILMLVSTDWCSYCKVQKKLVQKNDTFKKQASNFYYVEFDAESFERVIFNKIQFNSNNKKKRKTRHEFTIALNGNNKPVYPMWIVLNEKYQIIYKRSGFLKPKFLDELINKI